MKLGGLVFGLVSLQGALAFTSQPAFSRRATCLSGTLDGKAIDGEFTPTNNMVLVKLASEDQETAGGLVLSAKVKIKKNEGTVMSVGPGKINQESGVAYDMPLAPGDNVVFGGYGTEINYNGEKCMLIRDDDVLVKYVGGKLSLDTAEVLRDNVLANIEKKEQEDSVGGILLAKSSSAKVQPTIGQVVKVGRGRCATNGVVMDMDVAPGDMIKFRSLAGTSVEIDDEDYSVVQMNSIVLKF